MGSYNKERYEYCKLNGICTACRERPAFSGKLKCEECAERDREKSRRRREYCKANGICTRCGKEPASSGNLLCEECSERVKKQRKEDYQHYKSLGICTECHNYSAVTGKTVCEFCAEKQISRYEKIYSDVEKRKQMLAKDMEIYYRHKAKGECPGCGKPTEGGFTFCLGCRKKQRIRDKIRREEKGGLARSELPNYGICFRCCKNPVMEGKRLCAACYGTTVRTLEIARNSENAKKQREYFKSMNYLDFTERRESGRMSYTV